MADEQEEKPIKPGEESLTDQALQQPEIVELTPVEVTGVGNEEILNFLLREMQHETDDAKRKQKLAVITDLKELMYDVRKKEIELARSARQAKQEAINSKRSGNINLVREIGILIGILALFIILAISAYYTFALNSNMGLFLMCMIISIIAYGTYVAEFNFSFGELFKFEGKAKDNEIKKP